MKTHQDVITTLRKLAADFKANPNAWENPTLERYLDAMAAWLEDASKRNQQPPSWELIVQMLEAAKIYE